MVCTRTDGEFHAIFYLPEGTLLPIMQVEDGSIWIRTCFNFHDYWILLVGRATLLNLLLFPNMSTDMFFVIFGGWLKVKRIYTVVKVDGTTPKRWISKGP